VPPHQKVRVVRAVPEWIGAQLATAERIARIRAAEWKKVENGATPSAAMNAPYPELRVAVLAKDAPIARYRQVSPMMEPPLPAATGADAIGF
jgi:hypothetical protein